VNFFGYYNGLAPLFERGHWTNSPIRATCAWCHEPIQYRENGVDHGNLSAQQLRRAAAIKEQIQSLENELNRIFNSSTKPVAVAALKKRRKMSAAGRARIAAAAKARWAKVKAAKKSV
jgi:hypothetical protein